MTQPCLELVDAAAQHVPAALPCSEAIVEEDDPFIGQLRPRLPLIEDAVAQVFGIDPPELRKLTRGRAPVALARQVAMYVTHIVFSLPMVDTGRLFGRDRTTVAHACGVVEDMRDDPVFDRVIELLEGIVPALVLPRPSLLQPFPN